MFSIEFWVVCQLVFQLVLVMVLLFIVRGIRAAGRREMLGLKEEIREEVTRLSASRVLDMLTPLMEDAARTAAQFEEQIREKQRLMAELNETLDKRIISLNLLVNRSEAAVSGGYDEPIPMDQDAIYEQQDAIFEMHGQGMNAGAIAGRLSLPQGEVELVLELKNKFKEMEQDR